MRPRLRVERGGGAHRRRAAVERWRRTVSTGHLRLLAAGASEPWTHFARRLLVPLDSLSQNDLPPGRRGPHPLFALASYGALVLLAMTVVAAITAVGRLVESIL